MGDRLATIDMGRKVGCVLLFRESRVPIRHNVVCTEAYLRTKWHLDPSSHLAITDMGRKLGAVPPFFGGGSCVPIQHKVAWAKANLHTKWHLTQSPVS